jgi:hypothetical protein
MSKKVKFGRASNPEALINRVIVNGRRLTIDVSDDLHQRIKLACVGKRQKMADVIRELLEARFPK